MEESKVLQDTLKRLFEHMDTERVYRELGIFFFQYSADQLRKENADSQQENEQSKEM